MSPNSALGLAPVWGVGAVVEQVRGGASGCFVGVDGGRGPHKIYMQTRENCSWMKSHDYAENLTLLQKGCTLELQQQFSFFFFFLFYYCAVCCLLSCFFFFCFLSFNSSAWGIEWKKGGMNVMVIFALSAANLCDFSSPLAAVS